MYPINPPLTTGNSNPDVQNLQDVLLFLIQKGDILNPSQFSISALASERSSSFFGGETGNWIIQFKAQYGLTSPPQELVNVTVADKLNEILTPYFDMPFIIGGAVMLSNDLPLSFAKIEIWCDSFGMVAAGNTDAKGSFIFSIGGSAGTHILQTPATSLQYKIFRNQVFVSQDNIVFQPGVDVALTVDEEIYDGTTTDNTPSENVPSFLLVSGYVRDISGAVTAGVVVNIYEEGFRVRELIASTKTNSDGFYHLRIIAKNLGRYPLSITERANRRICAEAIDEHDTVAGLGYNNSFNSNPNITIDITATDGDTDTFTIRAFDQLKEKIDLVTDFADILSISLDSEISYIASAIGSNIAEVSVFINAHKIAADITTDKPELVYCLMRNGDPMINPVLTTASNIIAEEISVAIDQKIINEIDENDIEDFLDLVNEYQVAQTRALPIANEEFTLNDVLNAVFDDEESDLVNFLQAYNNAGNVTSTEFWTDYATTVGSTLSQRAKMGIQISALAGFQPEVVSSLLTDAVSNSGIHEFATWSESDWQTRINSICTASGRVCVPAVIKEVTDTNQDAQDEFAKTLKTTFQDLFPLTNVRGRLEGGDGQDLIEDEDTRDMVIAFILNNPDADLRQVTIHGINEEDYDLTDVSDLDKLKDGLEPFQRLLRLTMGSPEAVVAMKLDGLDSAEAMLDIAVEDFVASYSSVLGSVDKAMAVYSSAKLINLVASNSVININMSATNAWNGVNVIQGYPVNLVQQVAEDPNLRVLFGNLDYCSCQDCLSLYSPSAYLTDLLNFLRSKTPAAYYELMRRRGDLQHIDLTCKNTNTTLPYIDLVNELMENFIVDKIKTNYTPDLVPVKSFQTRGTVNELGAMPEHVEKSSGLYVDNEDYKKVYDDVLSQQVYPYSLPFSLAKEQTNVYLRQMGASRLELMTFFRANNNSSTTTQSDIVSGFSICAEALGITFEVAEIITDDSNTDTWLHYGIKDSTVTTSNGVADPKGGTTLLAGLWSTVLSGRLDVLLQQTKIEYKELLQFLNTEFLNPIQVGGTRLIYVDVNSLSVETDTCNLSELKLVFTSPATPTAFFGKLYRFIRLWRTSKYSIYEWDILFRSLNIVDLNNDDNLPTSEFQRLGRVMVASQKLGTDPLSIATWWNNVDMVQYTNFNSETLNKIPSRYDNIFRNRSVLNPPNPDFKDLSYVMPGDLPSSSDLPSPFSDYKHVVASYLQITEDELMGLASFFHLSVFPTSIGIRDVSITLLSKFHALANMAKILKLSIADFIKWMNILTPMNNLIDEVIAYSPTDTDICERIDELEALIERYNWILPSMVGRDGLDYLVRKGVDSEFYYDRYKKIQYFLEDLRRTLKKYPQYNKPVTLPIPNDDELFIKLSNIIHQKVATYFEVSIEIVTKVFPDMTVFSGDPDGLIYVLLSPLFVQSEVDLWFLNELNDGVDTLPLGYLYMPFLYQEKMYSIAEMLNLSFNEFKFLYEPETSPYFNNLFYGFGIDSIPGYGLVWTYIEPIAALDQWIRFKKKYRLLDIELIAIWNSIIDENKGAFMQILRKTIGWSNTDELMGNSGTLTATGLLDIIFPDDFDIKTFAGAKLMNRMEHIHKWTNVIGLNARPLWKGLLSKTDLTMSDAEVIMKAVKSKYIDEVWYKVAKPLRNELRNKQRKALTDYVISLPEPGYGKNWRNENELYAWFLIDVEMEPCSITSRIKQAICSVQLFVDRILLGIEYQYINPSSSPKITMTIQYASQWESWRKWYRIWEANRKVFLYPENWIEPDLRDDKSYHFEEMLAEINEGDMNNERMEEVLRNYLVKLDEVAHLEPVGSFHENDDYSGKEILHVFARTKTKPAKYYYRRLELGEWSAWEKMEIGIESDHIVPYVHRGKLFVYWATFLQTTYPGNKDVMDKIYSGAIPTNGFFYNDQDKPTSSDSATDNDPKYQFKQLEISLYWSEYKNGKWQDQCVASERMKLTINPCLDRDIDKYSRNPSAHTSSKEEFRDYYRFLSRDGALTTFDMLKSRIFLYPFMGWISATRYDFMIGIWSNTDIFGIKNENATTLHIWRFDDLYNPKVWETWGGYNQPAPKGTVIQNQKFVERPQNTKLYKDAPYDRKPGTLYVYPIERFVPVSFISRNSSDVILNKTTNYPRFKITSESDYYRGSVGAYNPMENRYFYADSKNTYFVYQGGYDNSHLAISAGTAFLSVGTITLATSTLISSAILSTYATASPAAAALTATAFAGTYTLGAVSSKGPYVFQTFYHPRTKDFIRRINSGGVQSLMDMNAQVPVSGDTMDFYNTYEPTSMVRSIYPTDTVEFGYGAAYSIYNWELFFHAPMMIAQKLKDNQQFAEARKWYHYIFDPTSNVDANGSICYTKQRFWKFRPFYDEAAGAMADISDLLEDISKGVASAVSQVHKWEDNPFKPHLIARMRRVAYMKNVVMKYLDNLIAWGDQLFERDTIESINEATQMYILASNILGPKPKEVPKRAYSAPYSFDELVQTGTLDAFSNAKVKIEGYIDNYIRPSSKTYWTGQGNQGRWVTEQAPKMFYFCLTVNDKLLKYWDTVADRLFKIRHCMNISGAVRELALFEPPIDPALLVKAAAAGIDTNSLLDEISGANVPLYKFQTVVQKANEVCGDIKALGAALLSALEKKDAESLAIIRSTQEIAIMESIRDLKLIQLEEAKAAIPTLEKSKEVVMTRYNYYSSRLFINPLELTQMMENIIGAIYQTMGANLSAMGSYLSVIPQFHIQAPFALGPQAGGQQIAAIFQGISTDIGARAIMRNTKANIAGNFAGYQRRYEDWQFQASSAIKEMEQIDKQIISANIRIAVSEKEIENQELQIRSSKETDAFMKSKYTNKELYNWLISQISSTYFQSYQVAYELAKKAEKTFIKELPFASIGDGFIKFGYWDSLKKGLMAGERLQLDIRRMETAYLDANKRELELTKHVSLAIFDPGKLIEIKELGYTSVTLPSWLFEMDYPGHYFRRIKTISLSIPCVAGPYTTINCTLNLATDGTVTDASGEAVGVIGSSMKSIATSSAQNDNGMFEMSFRDERYQPFEGCGLEDSVWSISLMDRDNLRQFDYKSISDVILHIKYTAQDGRSGVETVKDNLEAMLEGADSFSLPRFFSYAHEFSQDFFAGFNAFVPYGTNPANPQVARQFNLLLQHSNFPFYCSARTLKIEKIWFLLRPKEEGHTYRIEINGTTAQTMTSSSSVMANYVGIYTSAIDIEVGDQMNLPFKLYLFDDATESELYKTDIEDLLIICEYKLD